MVTPDGGNSVELLFGVKGGGSIDGESGAIIKEQINAIARAIEKDGTATRLKFSVDTSNTQNFKKDLQQINSITNNISSKPILTSKNFDYGSVAQYKNKINELMNSLQATNSGFDVSKLKITGFANATDSGKIAFTLFNKELQETRTVVLNLDQNELKTCSTQELLNKAVQQGSVNYAAMQKEQQKAIKASEQEANVKQRVANTHNSTLSAMMKYYRTNEVNLKANKELYQEFLALQSKMQNGQFKTSAQAEGAWSAFKVKADEAKVTTQSLGQQMKGLFQNRLGYMLAGYTSMAVYSSIRQLYTNVVDLDSALTQLQIVTGKSRQEIKAFGDDAANTAKKIGVSISDITSSTETYARLGYSLSDALNLSEITNSFSNIAAIDIDDATSGMTAILKGYNLDASQAEHVADVLTEVGQKYAVSASEIAEALQNGGAALHTANTSFEKSVGLVASGNAAIKCMSHNTVMYYRKIA